MKKLLSSVLMPLGFAAMALSAGATSPVARPEATVVAGNARFTVLTPEMVRIEYSDKGVFEDRATFTVQNREMEQVPEFTTREKDGFLYISTPKLTLKYRKGSNPVTAPASGDNLSVSMKLAGKPVVWYPGLVDSLNLKGTTRTLDCQDGDNARAWLEQGLVSRSGWAVIDDSWRTKRADGSQSFALEPNEEVGFDWWADRRDPEALDLYFMGYGHDYKRALGDFTAIAGKVPLPPAFVFGYWYSRYYPYTEGDFRQIMSDLKSNDIPADVLILDMDWHWNGTPHCKSTGRGGWTGWSWNTRMISEPEKLLDDIHANGLRAGLNLHPCDGVTRNESPRYWREMTAELGGKYDIGGDTIGWSIDYPDFSKSFFKNVIREHEGEGVDFWWLDWQQHLTSNLTPGLGETFWINHVFFNDMKRNRPDRRPLIFHRWGGLGCHRYQIGFSGDSRINFPTLAFQPYFTSTASNVGYAYWGHDLGGHIITDEKFANDPDLVLRWFQFGVFTPIYRSHASNDGRIERRIWKFPNFPAIRSTAKLRYALFPYIYTMARKTYDTGVGMCRPIYYEYPEAEEAYKFEGQYYFGDDVLVAPVTEAMPAGGGSIGKTIWFPKGNWWNVSSGRMVKGGRVATLQFGQEDIPWFVKEGAMIPMNPDTVMHVTDRPGELVVMAVAGASGEGSLYEDGGDNTDYDKVYARTALSHKVKGGTETFVIAPREGVSEGLPESRAWRLDVLSERAPKSVTVDGRKAQVSYDRKRSCASVKLPPAPCSLRREVKMSF